MPTIPTTEPTAINAGDTLKWDRTLSDYPASAGWSLAYILTNGPHSNPIAISSQADGDVYQVSVPATTTRGYTPGEYQLIGYASKDGERYRVFGPAPVTVNPDPVTAPPATSQARQMVDLLEAAIRNVASSGIVEYTVAGRGVRKTTLKEAREELAYWKRQLATERGLNPFRTVEVEFAAVD